MIHRQGHKPKLNIPRPTKFVGPHFSGRRPQPKIEVQGLAATMHTNSSALQTNGETSLAEALKNPRDFAQALEAQRPGFFKQVAIGAGLGLAAVILIPGLLKLGALVAIAGYVGVKVRKSYGYDAIQACLNMINAKEKVIVSMRQLVEGLRQQIRTVLSEVDRINHTHGADFDRLTRLARDEQRPRMDPEVQALEARLTAPFTQRRLLMARIETHEAEILLNNNRIALLQQNAEGLQTVKLILEQEQQAQRSRAEVIRAQQDVPTLASHDPDALAREAAEMAAGQRAQIDDLHADMTRDSTPTLPEGIGGNSDLFNQAKGDGL